MNLKGICGLALCMVIAGSASAEKVPYHTDITEPAGSCPTEGYKTYTGSGGAIPDCDPTGITSSVATDDDDSTIDDVILSVEASHTWAGDLRLLLSYDVDCDGTDEAGPVAALCRPLLDGCAVDGCCGCSGDLGGAYVFSDDGGAALGEPDCPDFIPPGCYGTPVDSPSPFAVFDGLAKGGCFTLHAQDGACADTGSISSFTVAVRNGPGDTPTETTSWGQLKATF